MFDTLWVADLDAATACEVITGTQQELREQEWRELVLAAHWADLHNAETLPVRTGPVLAGTERARQVGGPGTPQVGEFACAELALLMGTGYLTADNLLRDALDLRHRHPAMWTALGHGHARVWKARKVAALTHAAELTLEQARYVDAATTPYVDSLPGGRSYGWSRPRSSRPTPGGRGTPPGRRDGPVRGHRPVQPVRPENTHRPRPGR